MEPVHSGEAVVPVATESRRDKRLAAVTVPELEEAVVVEVPRPKKFRWDDKGAAKRRATGNIRALVGLNGSGKSYWAIHDIIPSLREGRRVLSTVAILDAHTGNPHPLYERLTQWGQLLNAERCSVIFDEVQGIANSRASQGMPVQVQTFLHQLRRRDIDLSWTSPSWSRADLLLREVTRTVTVCRGYFPEVRKDEGGARSWGANTLFRAITYDSADFTAWTDSSEDKLVGKINAWLYRPAMGPWGRPEESQFTYDTLDAVDRIGDVLDSGRCASCGGTRRPEPCSCADNPSVKKKAAKTAPVAAEGHSHSEGGCSCG